MLAIPPVYEGQEIPSACSVIDELYSAPGWPDVDAPSCRDQRHTGSGCAVDLTSDRIIQFTDR